MERGVGDAQDTVLVLICPSPSMKEGDVVLCLPEGWSSHNLNV